MRIAVGSDEDTPLASAVIRHLEQPGHAVDVVALNNRSTSEAIAAEILDAFLSGPRDADELAVTAGAE